MPKNTKAPLAPEVVLLTPFEAGLVLGITPGTLEVWRCTGRYPLPYVKIGKKVMYKRSDLMRFIESRTVHC